MLNVEIFGVTHGVAAALTVDTKTRRPSWPSSPPVRNPLRSLPASPASSHGKSRAKARKPATSPTSAAILPQYRSDIVRQACCGFRPEEINATPLSCPSCGQPATGFQPVMADRASGLSANEATSWMPVGQDRQDAGPPVQLAQGWLAHGLTNGWPGGFSRLDRTLRLPQTHGPYD